MDRFQRKRPQQSFRQAQETLASAAVGQIALAFASLRQRDTLRDQSIRDPLVGLFNRRVMQEALERELHRARRKHHRSPSLLSISFTLSVLTILKDMTPEI